MIYTKLSYRMSLKHVLIYIWLSSSSRRGRIIDDQLLDLALMSNYSLLCGLLLTRCQYLHRFNIVRGLIIQQSHIFSQNYYSVILFFVFCKVFETFLLCTNMCIRQMDHADDYHVKYSTFYENFLQLENVILSARYLLVWQSIFILFRINPK